MGRPPCCDKSNVKRGLWTSAEDAKILAHVSIHGPGLKRCGKSCRLRWTNYLRPDLNHNNFTPQEEELIVRLHKAIGSRWSLIAMQLPGRTDNDVKNHWNTKLRKKLFGMGIDPVTHRPFSQILADYGTIGGLPKCGIRVGSPFTREATNNPFFSKSDPSMVSQDSMMMPMMGAVQDSNPNHKANAFYENNYSWDLLAQLQAIKLENEAATNQETITQQSHFFTADGSSSSSNVMQVTSPPPPLPPSQLLPQGLKRCGKSCRLRWTNYLRPDLNHNNFTPQEEELIVRLHKAIGSR
ncbi:hypothetical protein GIB67_003936 [Kingdonia uniflora]|uniref:Uncharacterized protein n=1 Tax=Kingdonia uniflora TaxID=39325 RepID=A0A7J7MDT7_9MAGN|nr:hypothetical protein GIB67_003936 [Kingdonia uniflora]